MTGSPCQWCGDTATGTVTAEGLARPIPHCDGCWERTYREVRNRTPRTWKLIGPARPRRRRTDPSGPDLFDLLPKQGETT